MLLTDQILAVAKAYCVATDAPLGRASLHAFGDRRRLPGLHAGTLSVTLDRADRALAWFSAHWPASALWPDGVPRPLSDPPAPCAAEPNSGAVPEVAAALPAPAAATSRLVGAGLCAEACA